MRPLGKPAASAAVAPLKGMLTLSGVAQGRMIRDGAVSSTSLIEEHLARTRR